MDVIDNIVEDLPCPCTSSLIALLVSSKTWDLWCRRLSHPHPDHRSCLMLKFIFPLNKISFPSTYMNCQSCAFLKVSQFILHLLTRYMVVFEVHRL